MDENLHELDDLFSKALNEHNEPPSENIWEKIEKDLEKQKVVSITKKYQKWKWVAAALFIFSFGMAMYTINLRLKYKQPTGNSKEIVKTTKAKEFGGSQKSIDKEIIVKDSLGDKRAAINTTNISKKLGDTGLLKNLRETEHIEAKPAVAFKQEMTLAKGTEKRELALASRKSMKTFEMGKGLGKSAESHTANINNNSIAGIYVSAEANKNVYVDRNNYNVDFSVVANTKNIKDYSEVSMKLPNVNLSSLSPSLSNSNQKAVNRIRIASGFSANVYVSKDAISNSLKSNMSRFREDDRHEIEKAEKSGKAYTIGINIVKGISKKVSISSGISFSNRNTQIGTRPVIARPDGRGNINYRISSSLGYAYLNTKSGRPILGDSISSLSAKTSLQYFSVPLGLQYHLYFNKFSVNPEVSLIANFKTKAEISTVLKTINGMETSNSDNIIGLKNTYFDAAIRLNLAYNFSNNLGLVIMPSWRSAISSATNDGPVKTYVNSLNLGLGLKFEF